MLGRNVHLAGPRQAVVPDDGAYFFSAGEALTRMGMHRTWAEQFLHAYLAGPVEGENYTTQAQAYLK